MYKKILSISLTAFLASCSSNTVEINGNTYLKNDQGEIVLTNSDIDTLKRNPDILIIDKVMPDNAITVSSEELALISQDSDLFEEKVTGKINTELYIFALKTGSLKSNLERLSQKFSTEDKNIELNYDGVDYYIDEPKVMRSSSLELLVADILNDYPVVTSIY